MRFFFTVININIFFYLLLLDKNFETQIERPEAGFVLVSWNVMERYKEFEHAVSEVKIVGKRRPCGMPNWVTNKTIKLKSETDEAKQRFLVFKSWQSRERWQKLNSSYTSDEATMLNKQMENLRLADSKGEHTTIWKIIHDLFGKDK